MLQSRATGQQFDPNASPAGIAISPRGAIWLTDTEATGFIDPGGKDVHTLRSEGSTQAETIAVQLLPHGAP
jgi:predicted lysophospholipase L1 biosynthesis ABC-type transport system permease subunit